MVTNFTLQSHSCSPTIIHSGRQSQGLFIGSTHLYKNTAENPKLNHAINIQRPFSKEKLSILFVSSTINFEIHMYVCIKTHQNGEECTKFRISHSCLLLFSKIAINEKKKIHCMSNFS